ncbi:hypothetical protein ABW21_db0206661 [Orbilia brochopaga]|nr:hypothetical protein ABW21_db0206661 [Drechslerella brochopaga]
MHVEPPSIEIPIDTSTSTGPNPPEARGSPTCRNEQNDNISRNPLKRTAESASKPQESASKPDDHSDNHLMEPYDDIECVTPRQVRKIYDNMEIPRPAWAINWGAMDKQPGGHPTLTNQNIRHHQDECMFECYCKPQEDEFGYPDPTSVTFTCESPEITRGCEVLLGCSCFVEYHTVLFKGLQTLREIRHRAGLSAVVGAVANDFSLSEVEQREWRHRLSRPTQKDKYNGKGVNSFEPQPGGIWQWVNYRGYGIFEPYFIERPPDSDAFEQERLARLAQGLLGTMHRRKRSWHINDIGDEGGLDQCPAPAKNIDGPHPSHEWWRKLKTLAAGQEDKKRWLSIIYSLLSERASQASPRP